MLCEKCGKNEATVYYSETVNGKKRSMSLCSECAPAENVLNGAFPSIFSGIFGDMTAKRRTSVNDPKKCPVCGITFSEIARFGKVGCSECYTAFKNELSPSIRRIHGAKTYKGENSAAAHMDAENSEAKAELSKEDDLRLKLKAAVEEENYELAATLRDELRALTEAKNSEGGEN